MNGFRKCNVECCIILQDHGFIPKRDRKVNTNDANRNVGMSPILLFQCDTSKFPFYFMFVNPNPVAAPAIGKMHCFFTFSWATSA